MHAAVILPWIPGEWFSGVDDVTLGKQSTIRGLHKDSTKTNDCFPECTTPDAFSGHEQQYEHHKATVEVDRH